MFKKVLSVLMVSASMVAAQSHEGKVNVIVTFINQSGESLNSYVMAPGYYPAFETPHVGFDYQILMLEKPNTNFSIKSYGKEGSQYSTDCGFNQEGRLSCLSFGNTAYVYKVYNDSYAVNITAGDSDVIFSTSNSV